MVVVAGQDKNVIMIKVNVGLAFCKNYIFKNILFKLNTSSWQ